MVKTFTSLGNILASHSPHIVRPGRNTGHEIPELTDKGNAMMDKIKELEEDNDEMGKESDGVEIGDVLIELVG